MIHAGDKVIENPVNTLLSSKTKNQYRGLVSVCSGNFLVIETAIEQAKKLNQLIIIEATANQVNQFGGYTGLTPAAFANCVYEIADQCQLDRQQLILGGDHLGPMVWKNEPSSQAMEKAKKLIELYVEAGFTKIHLDTSMHLKDDDTRVKLPTELVADRTVELAKTAEMTWGKCEVKTAVRPVYVIGSEVPVAGGSTEDHSLSLPSPESVDAMISCFESKFINSGLGDFWQQVFIVVVQAGVEFSPHTIIEYDPEKAQKLSSKMKGLDDYLFECHSTDYQTEDSLRQLVRDGFSILKVGPGLTFALREALFALSFIEDELFKAKLLDNPSHFVRTLNDAMIKNPEYWQGHHKGTTEQMRMTRLYSYADRSRYYMGEPSVKKSISQLVENVSNCDVPLYLISQYLPKQYEKIRDKQLAFDPIIILKDSIAEVIKSYFNACDFK